MSEKAQNIPENTVTNTEPSTAAPAAPLPEEASPARKEETPDAERLRRRLAMRAFELNCFFDD